MLSRGDFIFIFVEVNAAEVDGGFVEAWRWSREHRRDHLQWLHQGLQDFFAAQGGTLRRAGARPIKLQRIFFWNRVTTPQAKVRFDT